MSTDQAPPVELFPKWRQAVRDFLNEFKYGDLITHEWLEAHFGMPDLAESRRMTQRDFSKRQFEWLGNIESFKNELLKDHQVMLASVRGDGYRWVPPAEQTKLATQAFEKDARKTFSIAGQRLRNVRLMELSDDERKENTDAIAKMAALRGMTRRTLLNKPPEKG